MTHLEDIERQLIQGAQPEAPPWCLPDGLCVFDTRHAAARGPMLGVACPWTPARDAVLEHICDLMGAPF
jgi:hypothetical protein